jgi:MSHA biogenesis protein MshI
MLSWWHSKQNNSWRVGVMPADRETALAIVKTGKGRPLLRHCAIHPAIEIKAEHVLAPLNRTREFARAGVSGVLNTEDYELVQVEAPEVHPNELRSAVRWKLRDIINFPVADAVIDVFDIPRQARYVETRMVFVVAARGEAVERIVRLIKPRVRRFDVMDIPEMCLRNVSALLPQDSQGVALVALGAGFAQLVLTCQGTLYLARRIALRANNASDSDGAAPGIDAASVALELQRSLDYYESHYDRPPINEIVIASGDARAEQLRDALVTETGMSVEVFDASELFDVAAGVEPDLRWPGLIALGAALRAHGSRS